MTPSCPLFLAAYVASERRHLAWSQAKPECIGSACAWWVRDGSEPRVGSCGLGNGQQFADPAIPPVPTPKAQP